MTLRNVFPAFAPQKLTHRSFRDAVFTRQSGSRNIARSELEPSNNDLIRSHLSGGDSLTTGLPALCHLVLMVVGVRAKEQMQGIHTRRIIPRRTVVADLHSLRNGSVVNLPRGTVRRNHSTITAKLTVPLDARSCRPYPASIWPFTGIYETPESDFRGCDGPACDSNKSHIRACLATEPSVAALNDVPLNTERRAARLTRAIDAHRSARHAAIVHAANGRWMLVERGSAGITNNIRFFWGTIESHSVPPDWVSRLGWFLPRRGTSRPLIIADKPVVPGLLGGA